MFEGRATTMTKMQLWMSTTTKAKTRTKTKIPKYLPPFALLGLILSPSVLSTPLGPLPSAFKIMAARNRLLIIWIRR